MPRKISMKTLRKRAWDECSRYIRQLYSDKNGWASCYTCGISGEWKTMQAGHAIPGRTNSVLLDTDILRVQCYGCNIHKRGAHHIFSTKLIKEHGLEWWENKLQQARQIVKYTRDDYERLAEEFRQKTEVHLKSRKWQK